MKLNNLPENCNILLTGGTGSFGKNFIKKALNNPNLNRLVIFSRDELKQWELLQKYPEEIYPKLRFFLGDIRDLRRVERALENIDIVVHAAALKQVPTAEYNPIEFINTNVIGAENLIQACLDGKSVRKVIALSTDKAAAPINLYGATKLCSDKLFMAANNIKGSRDIKFSVVRYGNVMGSRGSVIPFFLEKAKSGEIPITDPNMTRFNITLDEGVNMVFYVIQNALGGELFVPKIPSYRILDMASAIGPNCRKYEVGIRPGEKIHEEMITASDSYSTIDIGDFYVILGNKKSTFEYNKKYKCLNYVEKGFSYNSGLNEKFLNIDEIRSLIKDHVCKDFKPT